MIYFIFAAALAVVALSDAIRGRTPAHPPQPWPPEEATTPATRNPYLLKPYRPGRPDDNQPRRPGHPVTNYTRPARRMII